MKANLGQSDQATNTRNPIKSIRLLEDGVLVAVCCLALLTLLTLFGAGALSILHAL